MEKIDIHRLYLSEKEQQVLDLIILNPKIKQVEIYKKLKTTEGYVSKIIHKLAKNKIITKDFITKEFIIIDK